MIQHLVLIDPLSQHGGMHYYDYDIANSLASEGIKVTVIAPNQIEKSKPNFYQRQLFNGVYGNNGNSRFYRAIRLVVDTVRAINLARNLNADAIICHVFKFDFFDYFMVLVAYLMRIRCVAIIHDVIRLDKSTFFSFRSSIVRIVDTIVVHNNFALEAFLGDFVNARSKVTIMHHGNYVNHFNKLISMDEARSRLSLPKDRTIMLFFGNPRHEKGLHLLLESLALLPDVPNLFLLIAGKMKPDDEDSLRKTLAVLGLSTRVRLDVGHVPDDLMPVYYRAASFVVLPYLRIYESGVALMAMSFCRNILASNLPAFSALKEEGAAIRLFEAHNTESLSGALREAADPAVDWESEGLIVRSFVERCRSWNQSAATLLAALD
jgi:glycosyltransferase involved in cell wall biosynthesis